MHFKLESKEALRGETNRRLWNPIINAGDARRDGKEQDAMRARSPSRSKPFMELMKNDGGQGWATRTRAAMDVLLG